MPGIDCTSINKCLLGIGYVGEEALYLDPHITQRCGSVGEKLTASEIEHDETYHTKYAARIHFEKMDPSLGNAFTHFRGDFEMLKFT